MEIDRSCRFLKESFNYAQVFTPWLKEVKLSELWLELLRKPTREKCNELKAVVSKFKFTKEQRALLNKVLKMVEDHSIFAVRSSSPEEDLEGASFAGMYETLLGVTQNKLESAIAHAFSSMLDFRVIEYKKLKHIDLKNTCIAVIVQRQIKSDVSGIGFSLNPRNNCYDEAVINASFGLGETIVSGVVTPDTYIVEKVKNEILNKKINKKIMKTLVNRH